MPSIAAGAERDCWGMLLVGGEYLHYTIKIAFLPTAFLPVWPA